jgi:hypothetical protein
MLSSFAKGTAICVPLDIQNSNSIEGYLQRIGTRCLESTAQITGNNETITTNVFVFTGSVRVVDQWAIITDDTALTNATNIYADIYDGTNTVNLTNDGMTLSGAPVGTFFTKDQVSSQIYSSLNADECRMLETLDNKRVGRPFLITGKNGVDNYIRFHVTTNTTLDFSFFVHFEFQLLNGATLEFA